MHEVGIAMEMLRIAEIEVARQSGGRLSAIGLRLGEFSGVDAEALRFAFDAIVKDTPQANVKLAIEQCPRTNRCSRCQSVFPVVNYEVVCPACGSADTSFASGDELDLAYVELEE